MNEPIVAMKKISKSFSGVKVLQDVDFNIYKGKIMGFIGENGAGKSTLMKILTGVYSLDKGSVLVGGKEVHFKGIKDSQDLGIAFIHQELNLVQDLSIAENIFLGREPMQGIRINQKKMKEDALYWMERMGLDENPNTLVKELSIGKQQLVEIAKALSLQATIIILDEPTGALSNQEVEKLFSVLKDLQEKGHSMVYISHRLEEIFRICDHITVLRDGELIAEVPIDQITQEELIEKMVGRTLQEKFAYESYLSDQVLLVAEELKTDYIRDVSFELHPGEVLGVAGLMGSGRTEIARALYGIDPLISGKIILEGKEVMIKNPKHALENGITYVSEDRKKNGVFVNLSVAENISISSLPDIKSSFGRIQKSDENNRVQEYISKMSIKTTGPKQLLRFLSGGNQQKVSLAKNLNAKPKVLILDEPTRGVDVGAKKEIYDMINELKSQNLAIIMISSEIEEILGMSDRILVMNEGRLKGILSREEASQQSIMSTALQGGKNE